nr:NAD(P)H-hydrate dehydratase [Paracoccus saliphilus]
MLHGTQILGSAQMRAIESAAIAQGTVTAATLMERAGQGVVTAILDRWPDLAQAPGQAVVLCGPGNNGGDGFVVARLLAGRGWQLRVLLAGDPAALPADARRNHDLWRALGPVAPLSADPAPVTADLAVDALFGIGLTRPVDAFAPALSALRAAPRLVAVDVPSGLCADSGQVIGAARLAPADLTVTFHRAKPGHYLSQGPGLCGHVALVDLGLADAGQGPPTTLIEGADLAKPQGHKFDHGHVMVVAGGPAQGGAARLSARAALRIGAGLVTLCPPQAALAEHSGPPDALMRRPLDGSEDLERLLGDGRVAALCLGPGCGIERAASLLPPLIRSGRAAVLDADAITALAAQADPFRGLHDRCVLTPHAGEFGRLFPDLATRLDEPPQTGPAFSRLDAARQAAARTGAVILLKGPDTVIAAPDGRAAIHSATDLPWLATAGAGDVLAGMIAGLLARGWPALEAASAATLVHARAARRFGPGLIADDLPDQLPFVLRDMGA